MLVEFNFLFYMIKKTPESDITWDNTNSVPNPSLWLHA